MHRKKLITGMTMAATVALSPGSVLAHHVMDGGTPTSFYEGLLSGLAHPVIGIDHLAFVICVGLLAFLAGQRFLLPLIFVTGTLAGTAMHLTETNFPFAELIILASVAVAGLLTFFRAKVGALWLSILFSGAGLFHGYAYAESIMGAETTPFVAYLLGFSIIQYGMAVFAGTIFMYFSAGDFGRERKYAKIVGSVVVALSVYLATTSGFVT